MTPEQLAGMLQSFLAGPHQAVMIEDGATVFDMSQAEYEVSAQGNNCVLHVWSAERNAVRRVLDAEIKGKSLRMEVLRFGQSQPHRLELFRDGDRATPAARDAVRARYQRLLHRVLQRNFPGDEVGRLTSKMDLQRSLSQVYCRGMLRRGRSAFAVLGVSSEESRAAIDGSLTAGLLWLNQCREREAGRIAVEGLKLFVPAGTSQVVRARMSNLNHDAAKFHLFELEEREEQGEAVDWSDGGNLHTRLARLPDYQRVRERLKHSLQRIRDLAPGADEVVTSPTEIVFRIHGLEFARARLTLAPGSFKQLEEVLFGLGDCNLRLDPQNEAMLRDLAIQIRRSRNGDGDQHDDMWRLHPERWLESLLLGDLGALDTRLDATFVYSQVPAFSAADRVMIDLLASTRDGRLTVLELKADEDIHLAMQGLDYWARVKWHHERGEFRKFGYFAGKELSSEPPLLVMVAPAMRIHPATDTLLRYLSPRIDWTLVGIDERWRKELKVIFRKRRVDIMPAPADSSAAGA